MKTNRIIPCIIALSILAVLAGNPEMSAARQTCKPVLVKVTQKQALKILKNYCKDMEYKTFDLKQYPQLKKYKSIYYFYIGVHGDCEADYLYLVNKSNGDIYMLYPIGKPQLLQRAKRSGWIHQKGECNPQPFLAEA